MTYLIKGYPLADLTCSWRNYEYVFVADVEKIYRQVLVHPEDRKYQSILWREEPTEVMNIFQLETVSYGIAPFSYLSRRAQTQLSIDQRNE